MIKVLKSDFMKLKATPTLLIHILMPIIGVCIFTWYTSISQGNFVSNVAGYFQVLALAFPTLIAIVCTLISEQELMAGNGYNLLALTTPKVLACISKMILLSYMGLASTIIATCGFGIIMHFIFKNDVFSISFYLISALVLFFSNFALYVIHFFISLRFGKGLSIGLGIVESLVSALMITGLGERIWTFIPCGWSIRLITLWTGISNNQIQIYDNRAIMGIIICIVASLLAFLLLMIWFLYWEGEKSYE